MPFQFAVDEQPGKCAAAELGNDGSQGHAAHVQVQAEHKHEVEHDIQNADQQGDVKRGPCILHAQQPADESHVQQYGGRAPDRPVEVNLGIGPDVRSSADKVEAQVYDRSLE